MNYIIYVDVYFFVNFFMDGLILLLLRMADGKGRAPARGKELARIAAAAFLGGAISCLAIWLLPKASVWLRLFLIHGLCGYLMVWMAFGYKGARQRLQALGRLCLLEAMAGGILQMAIGERGFLGAQAASGRPGERSFLSVMAVGLFGAMVFWRVWSFHRREQYMRSHLYGLKLRHNGKSCQGTGLLDTGNHLRDPIFGKPVVIAQFRAVEKLIGTEQATCVIPYHSLGKKHGYMPGIIMDEMTVYKEEGEQISKKVLIGVMKEELSGEGLYQFILHEELCNG